MGMSTMVRQRDDWGVTGIEDHGTWTRFAPLRMTAGKTCCTLSMQCEGGWK